ncbi:hypothetical protein [uncultured Dokdonia sp.]|uniref:hypothetical protein n=1 Tax=uncultured Dokdonia sp. TaxID=575653 RepID=UPI002621E933|nr:hypothetical protein [uncultured Dokdonia sp.]
MIPIYKEDFLEQEELYDDFNLYRLPMRPIRTNRGIAQRYRPKKRSRTLPRVIRGIGRPYSLPSWQTQGRAKPQILLSRKQAIQFGKPRQTPLKRSPLVKMATTTEKSLEIKKKVAPSQRASARRVTKEKVKALKEEVAQKEDETQKPESGKGSKKKILIVALVITTTAIVGYVVWKGQKKDRL